MSVHAVSNKLEHEYHLKEFDEYIFSPFDTNVFLKLDEKNKTKYDTSRISVLNILNNECNKYHKYNINWKIEDDKKYKLAKGVFTSSSKEKSFVMGTIKTSSLITFTYKRNDNSRTNNILCKVEKIEFYIYEYGIGTMSMKVSICAEKPITVEGIDGVSEFLNRKFREMLLDICVYIKDSFRRIACSMEMMLSLELFERNNSDDSQNCIPWTHRIYHINDNELLMLDNPGEIFRFLLTPSSQVDIYDFSIYDNRYIYFGWGHSIIITNGYEDHYEQTKVNIAYYIRLVEICQAKWQCVNNVNNIVDSELLSFNSSFEDIRLKHIEKTIYEIQLFSTNIKSILRSLDDLKITFDTEKRNLLKELNSRWYTDTIKESLLNSIDEFEKKLSFLHDRKTNISNSRLNTILFILTIINSIQIFVTIYNLNWINSSKVIMSEGLFTFSLTAVLIIYITLYLKKLR